MANEQATGTKLNGMWPIAIFGITLLINLGVAVSTLWVKSGYVPKGEFDAYKADQQLRREKDSVTLQLIAVDIGKISVQMGENEKQDRRLESLERRMGEQERAPNK